MRRTLIAAALVFLLAVLGITLALNRETPAPASTPATSSTRSDLRNARYCEIIPVVRRGLKITAYVYNTLGLNDCPAEAWAALDAETIAKEYGAIQAKMNGPRYWVIDKLESAGATASGETYDFGGVLMILRAEIETRVGQTTVGDELYTPNEVQRTTVFTYRKGAQVYELISPEGDVYMMQSYAQIVDPELSIDDLETLGDRLALPQGWQYRSRVLDEDYRLAADGLAYVINDDLLNSYQRAVTGSEGK